MDVLHQSGEALGLDVRPVHEVGQRHVRDQKGVGRAGQNVDGYSTQLGTRRRISNSFECSHEHGLVVDFAEPELRGTPPLRSRFSDPHPDRDRRPARDNQAFFQAGYEGRTGDLSDADRVVVVVQNFEGVSEQVHPIATTDVGIDQRSRGRLIAVGLARTRGMTNTTTTNKSTITKTKSNGTNPEETSEQSAAAPSPTSTTTTAPEKKPLTVLVSEQTHRKAKITAELSGVSLSDLVEAQLKILVKEKLPALLAGLDAEG